MNLQGNSNFIDLGKAKDRFQEVLETPIDDKFIVRDAAIKCFKFTIELMWLNFKYFLEKEGKEALSPKHAVSLAYQMKWFDEEKLWLEMLNDRNKTSHTYKQAKADEVYANIKKYYPEMRAVYEKLKSIAER